VQKRALFSEVADQKQDEDTINCGVPYLFWDEALKSGFIPKREGDISLLLFQEAQLVRRTGERYHI